MTCATPKLKLPSVHEFGSFKANYHFDFLFNGFEGDQGLDGGKYPSSAITFEMDLHVLPQVEEQHWHSYDVTKREVLDLKAWSYISNL